MKRSGMAALSASALLLSVAGCSEEYRPADMNNVENPSGMSRSRGITQGEGTLDDRDTHTERADRFGTAIGTDEPGSGGIAPSPGPSRVAPVAE